jgi:hypothetical protein
MKLQIVQPAAAFALAITLIAGSVHAGFRPGIEVQPGGEATRLALAPRVSFEMTGATLSEVLATITSRTGVSIHQTPEAAAAAIDPRLDVRAVDVPAELVLSHVLSSLSLAPEVSAHGVSVKKRERGSGIAVLRDGVEIKGSPRIVVHENPGERVKGSPEVRVLSGASEEDVAKILESVRGTSDEKRLFVRKVARDESTAGSAEKTNERVRKLIIRNQDDQSEGSLEVTVRNRAR